MITDYEVSGKTDTNKPFFGSVLRLAGSPAAAEADPMYDALVREGIKPLAFLAFFRQESRFGVEGIVAAYNTRNPGNVRSPERASLSTDVIATPRGNFAVYPSWTAGTLDWALRLKGSKYAGRGLLTVRQILPVYAPSGDADNSPTSYINNVLASVTAWLAIGAAAPEQTGGPTMSYTRKQLLVPSGQDNRPGGTLVGGKASSYTIHNTANRNRGANAQMHAKFVFGGGGDDSASFHDVVDDHELYQLIPYNEPAFHVGDWPNGPGWKSSYGIEVCENADGDFQLASWIGAQAVADRMVANGHTGQYALVRTHGSWWTAQNPAVHRGCPSHYLDPNDSLGVTWNEFVGMVRQATEAQQIGHEVPPQFPLNYDEVTRLYIDLDFLSTWSFKFDGRPLGPACLYTDGWKRQLFERTAYGVKFTGGKPVGEVVRESLGAAYLAATGKNVVEWPGVLPLL